MKDGDAVRRIVINIQNSLFCNAIADTLRSSENGLQPYRIDSPDKEKEVTPPGDDNDDDTTKPEDKPSDSPQTGDDSNMFFWIALLFIIGAGVVATTVYGKKKFSVK